MVVSSSESRWLFGSVTGVTRITGGAYEELDRCFIPRAPLEARTVTTGVGRVSGPTSGCVFGPSDPWVPGRSSHLPTQTPNRSSS